MFIQKLTNRIDTTYHFNIEPAELRFNNQEILSGRAIEILEKHNIELKLEIYDSDIRKSGKPILILVHGNSSSKKVFNEHIKNYSEDYRVIAIDLLGHGESTKISNLENLTAEEINILSETFYNPCAMIAQLKQFFEKKNIKNAHVLGWSLGGHLAYGIAVENPELVSSITAIGSPPVIFSTEGFKQGFGNWFVNTLLPEWVNDPKPIPIEQAEFIRSHMGFKVEEKFFIHDLVNADPQMRRHLFLKLNEYDNNIYKGTGLDGENFAKTTQIPLNLIVVKEDMGISSDYIASFKGQLQHSSSRVYVIDGTHHAVWNTDPVQYYKIVSNFISNCVQQKQNIIQQGLLRHTV